MLKSFLLVGAGSFFGGGLRYVTQQLISKLAAISFPFGTFTVNMLGSLLIGIFFGLSFRYTMFSSDVKLLIITGFCGGYTTFSAFSIEIFDLIKSGGYFFAGIYILSTLLIGVLLTFLGYYMINFG